MVTGCDGSGLAVVDGARAGALVWLGSVDSVTAGFDAAAGVVEGAGVAHPDSATSTATRPAATDLRTGLSPNQAGMADPAGSFISAQ